MGDNNQQISEKKRKHSSDNTKIGLLKTPRNGCSPKDPSNTHTVSESLHNANSILYDDSYTDLNLTVFESNEQSESAESVTSEIDTENKEAENMAAKKKGSCSNGDLMTYLKTLDAKVSRMDKRLNTLDSLEEKVTKFEKDLNKLWTCMSDQLNVVNEKLADTVSRVDSLSFSIGEAVDDIQRLQKERGQMKDELLYVQSQSMRKNLVFGNTEEDGNETNDQTEQKLRSFLEEKLKMAEEGVKEISFERVHRMGQRSGGARASASKIVAKLRLFKGILYGEI